MSLSETLQPRFSTLDEGPSSDPEPVRIRTLCLDLLGRPPLAEELPSWGALTRADVVGDILEREEFWQHWLDEQLYYFLLIDNFRPETEGVVELPARLQQREIGVLEALHRICLSSSFDRRNPGPDTFVTVVMEQLLGLTVQKTPRELEIGKKVYDGTMGKFLGRTGSSQADVVDIAFADPRAIRYFLAREFVRMTRQEADPKELEGWAARLLEHPLAYLDLVSDWLASRAYEQRLTRRTPLPNRHFVRALFVDLLGRLPSLQESQRIRSALDGLADARPLRSLLARLLLDSGKADVPERAQISDPEAWIAGSFERLLGRSAAPAELAQFLEVFRDPACKPTTVLYAIVSHPEYQTW